MWVLGPAGFRSIRRGLLLARMRAEGYADLGNARAAFLGPRVGAFLTKHREKRDHDAIDAPTVQKPSKAAGQLIAHTACPKVMPYRNARQTVRSSCLCQYDMCFGTLTPTYSANIHLPLRPLPCRPCTKLSRTRAACKRCEHVNIADTTRKPTAIECRLAVCIPSHRMPPYGQRSRIVLRGTSDSNSARHVDRNTTANYPPAASPISLEDIPSTRSWVPERMVDMVFKRLFLNDKVSGLSGLDRNPAQWPCP